MVELSLYRVALLRLLLLLQLTVFAKPADDFADVNSILGDVIVKLPDVPTMSSAGYSIELTEVVCSNLSIRDSFLTSRSVGLVRESSAGVQLQWSIKGLAFDCEARYKYKGLLGVVNRGDVYLYSRGNNAVATATVSAPLNGSPQPPTNVVMNSCAPEVQIVDIDFKNGGFIGWILDAIEALLRTAMENMASDKICEELQTFLEVNTKFFLENIAGENMLKPYLPTQTTTAATIIDPLQYEYDFIQQLMNNENIFATKTTLEITVGDLLNFREQDTSTGRWMNELIRKGVDVSNELVPSPPDLLVQKELRVNQWLRDVVLEDGALIVESSSSGPEGFPADGILYDGEDLITHTTIALDRVKLLGLDTLTRFSPFDTIGNYTLETSLGWKYLALELDATMTVRPSTRPDSMIETTTSSSGMKIVEEVKVIFGVDGLEAGAALVAALNQTALESIMLGSLLKSSKAAIGCVLSTFLDLEFASLSLQVTSDVLTPSIEGLVSPGLDRLVVQGMDALFLMYEQTLLEAAPIYFQNELRPMLTQKLLNEYVMLNEGDDLKGTVSEINNGRECIPWAAPEKMFRGRNNGNKTVDFRDLLLSVEEAIALGGSGYQIYGDLFSGTIMPYLNEELSNPDVLNVKVIPAITKEQSGKEGVLEFTDLFRYFNTTSSSPLYDALDFRVSKMTISNIDTMEGPLAFLQPTNKGNILQSRFAMNSVEDPITKDDRYLNVTFRVYLEIAGDDSPFQMKNEVDFSVSIPSASFAVAILANLKEKSLVHFPLKDIANPYCWLAALGSPNVNYEAEGRNNKDLTISALSFSLSEFYLNTICVFASSPGCSSISEVLRYLEDFGFASSFRNDVIKLVENVAVSFWDALDFENLIEIAPKYCPHSGSYYEELEAPPLQIPDLSGMSKLSSETILTFGIIFTQVGFIVSAKNHLFIDQQSPLRDDQSSTGATVDWSFPEGRGIIDWTDLSGQFGSWVEILFDEFRKSLSSKSVLSSNDLNLARGLAFKTTPSVNIMLRDYILDDSGYLEFPLENISFTKMGVTISMSKVRVGGLDTVTWIEPLVVVDPYRMQTALQLEELIVSLECNVATVDDLEINQVELVYKAKDILLEIDTRIALNTTEIGQIQVGSLFDSSKAIRCMMRGIQAFEISKINFTLAEFESPSITGLFSSEVQLELNRILDSLHNAYQNEILLALPMIVGSTMREIINTMIPDVLKSMSMECPSPPQFLSDGLIDYREMLLKDLQSKNLGGEGSSSYGDIFQILYNILDKEVMQTGASNRPVLNDFIERMTKKQSNTTGTINVSGTALETQSLIQIAGLQADLRVEVLDVVIQNLDSIGDPLYLLKPVNQEANVLDNKLSFGVNSKPLRFEGTMILSIDDGADMNIRNEIHFSFLVEDVTVRASILLKLLENSISSFPLQDFPNLNCWAATILPTSNEGAILEGLQLLDQVYSTGDFEMEISCKSCTSPDFDEFLLSLYEPDDITSAISEQTSNLMDSEFAQRIFKDIMAESKKKCPHRPEFDPDYEAIIADSPLFSDIGLSLFSSEKKKNPMYFSIANSVVATCLIIAGFLAKFIIARRNKNWVQSLTNEGQFLLDCQQEKQRGMDEWLDEHTTSLFTSPFIPKSVRWGVPILLLINTGLYLVGHFGLLSVVNLDVTIAGQSFTIENFLEFRFLESTKKAYDNGGAEMIILLWICTGIWPYVKLLISLVIWVAPPKYLSVKRRRTVLLWIDALVRLSVIDIFTLVIGFAILFVFIGGRDNKSRNEEGMFYALKAIVIPKAGCYCIIVAQRMSRVSSQFFLEYHGKVVEKSSLIRKNREGDLSISQIIEEGQSRINTGLDSPSIRVTDAIASNYENPRVDLEAVDHKSRIATGISFFQMPSLKTYRWGHLGAILGGITIAIVFVIGCVFVPAVAFDISSIGGITLDSELTYEGAVSEYGVFLVISGILLKARFVLNTKADYVGLGLLLAAAGVSISLMFIIKSYHFIRKKIRERRDRLNHPDQKPSYGHEGCGLPFYFRLYKWNHMEIYFISLCIGVWQLGSIISYTIHLYCCILTDVFDILTSIGIVEPAEAQCNRIQASLVGNLIITIGSFLILLAAFYLQAYGQYKKNVMHASKYVDDKDVPTLSLAWSQDKSKNKRYSHLTESLSLSIFDSDTTSSRTGTSSVTNPSESTFPRTGISFQDSRGRSVFTESSTMSNTSIQQNSSYDTIEEDPNEDEISVPVALPVSDASSECSHRSSTIDEVIAIDAPCELANNANSRLQSS